jgi:hypothetical protein
MMKCFLFQAIASIMIILILMPCKPMQNWSWSKIVRFFNDSSLKPWFLDENYGKIRNKIS